jgi:leucyl/phenylalanyl-tRNA--protein transferase
VKHLLNWGYRLIDCQVYTDHLVSLGAEEMPRTAFISLLDDYCDQPPSASAWRNEGMGG